MNLAVEGSGDGGKSISFFFFFPSSLSLLPVLFVLVFLAVPCCRIDIGFYIH